MICTQVTIINSIVTLDWTLWSGGKKVNKSADVPNILQHCHQNHIHHHRHLVLVISFYVLIQSSLMASLPPAQSDDIKRERRHQSINPGKLNQCPKYLISR